MIVTRNPFLGNHCMENLNFPQSFDSLPYSHVKNYHYVEMAKSNFDFP